MGGIHDMYIQRILEKKVLELSSQFPVVCVYGARSVGKSTMLNHILPKNFHTAALDSEFEKALCKQDPRGYLLSHGLPLFIDEVQNVPEIFDEIKAIVDEHARTGKSTQCLFWISGSNKLKIKTRAKETLAGRVAILEMSSLSKEEIEGQDRGVFNPFYSDLSQRVYNPLTQPDLFKRIFIGGYPKLFKDPIDREVFFRSYIDTYIERDIKSLIEESSLTAFTNLMIYLSARIAQQINVADASKVVGVNTKTINRWLDILEESGIIFRLKPYANKVSKRLVSIPKLYFMDTGLAAYMARWFDSEQMRIGAASGHFLENYVVSEVVKSHYNHVKRLDFMFYYRDYDQKEFDLLFVDNVRMIPIEIKKNPSPDVPSVDLFDKFNLSIPKKYILYGGDKVYQLSSGWTFLPIATL